MYQSPQCCVDVFKNCLQAPYLALFSSLSDNVYVNIPGIFNKQCYIVKWCLINTYEGDYE